MGPLSPSITRAEQVEDAAPAGSLPRARVCTEPAPAISTPLKSFVPTSVARKIQQNG